MIKCIIVDDEPIARDILANHVLHTPDLMLVANCTSAQEASAILSEHSVDLIFLDIQMPVTTGINFLKCLLNPPLVIFTTAYSDHAVEGFNLNAVDYLLKPIVYERFYRAVERARLLLNTKEGRATSTTNINSNQLFIKQEGQYVKINTAELVLVQAEKDFCSLFFDSRKLLVSMHLKLVEAKLPPERFPRVHKSYLVNVNKIISVKGNILIMPGREIPIGTNYKEGLFKLLGI